MRAVSTRWKVVFLGVSAAAVIAVTFLIGRSAGDDSAKVSGLEGELAAARKERADYFVAEGEWRHKAEALEEGRVEDDHPARSVQETTKPAMAFQGKYLKRYREDKLICGIFPEARIAKEFHVPGAERAAIAQAYAEGFYGEFERAAFAGCLAGLHP